MRMSLLLLALLAPLASSESTTKCIKAYKPKLTDIRSIPGPLDPTLANDLCNKTHPGYGVLKRGYRRLLPEMIGNCTGSLVPLGMNCSMNATNPTIFWTSDKWFHQERMVNSTYLEDAVDATLCSEDRLHFIGMLNTTTRKWSLTNAPMSVECALCERAWRDNLNDPAGHPFLTPGGALEVQLPLNLVNVTSLFTTSFGSSFTNASLMSVVGNVTTWRVRTKDNVNCSSTIAHALKCQDLHRCQDNETEDKTWYSTRTGNTRSFSLPLYMSMSRECYPKRLQDGDWNAVWDDVVYWYDLEAPCWSNETRVLATEVAEYSSKSASEVELNRVLELMASFARHNPSLANPEDNAKRNAIFRDFANLLASLLQQNASITSVQCSRLACVALRPQGVVTVAVPNAQLNASVKSVWSTDSDWSFEVRVPGVEVAVSIVHNYSLNFNLFQAHANTSFQYHEAAIVQVVLQSPLRYVEVRTHHIPRVDPGNDNASRPCLAAASTQTDADIIPCHLTPNDTASMRTHRTSRELWLSLGGVWQLDPGNDNASRPCLAVASNQTDANIFRCYLTPNDTATTRNATLIAYRRWKPHTPKAIEGGKVEAIVRRYREVDNDNASLGMVVEIVGILGVCDKELHYADHLVEDVVELALGVDLGGEASLVLDRTLYAKVLVTNSSAVIGVSQRRLSGNTSLDVLSSEMKINSSAVHYTLGHKDHKPEALIERLVVVLAIDATRYPEAKGRVLSDVRVVILHNQKHEDIKNLFLTVTVTDGPPICAKMVTNVSESPCACAEKLDNKQIFVLHDFEKTDGRLIIRALLFEAESFTDFVTSNGALTVVMITAAVLAVGSWFVIVLTAFTLKAWRRDLGHRVLLQVTLALSLNLALSLTTSFFSLNVKSSACIALGAFRHVTYIATFLWMLAQSLLQLHRLVTKLGTREPLFWHASAVAWGLPLAGVGLLLLFDAGLYRPACEERGFCYPEGLTFHLTVQAPAVIILVIHLSVYIAIVACMSRGWSGGQAPRPINAGLAHIKRLVGTAFIWLAWFLHFLAEQGLWGGIESRYFFNVLFLVAASVHLFSLAAFFVFCDADTRKDWRHELPTLRRHAAVATNDFGLRLRGK